MVHCDFTLEVRMYLLEHEVLFPRGEPGSTLTERREGFYLLMAHAVLGRFGEVCVGNVKIVSVSDYLVFALHVLTFSQCVRFYYESRWVHHGLRDLTGELL